jgi:hypothetical protein
MHPVQLELLAKAHIEELGRRPARLLGVGGRKRRSFRGATGWFLVNLGLRLAVRRPAVPVATR